MSNQRQSVSLGAKPDKGASKGRVAWKPLTVRIPHEVRKALKIRAAEEEKTVGCVVENLIREYLAKGGHRD